MIRAVRKLFLISNENYRFISQSFRPSLVFLIMKSYFLTYFFQNNIFVLDYLSVFYREQNREQNQTSMDVVLEQETYNLVTNIGLR